MQPGTYTFRVIGSNNSGLWNTEGASLKIIIRPPWWRTLVAIIAYILLLGGAAYTFIRVRERKMVRDRKILEEKIFERTEELNELNTRLEEHREELEQQKEELEQTLNYLKETQTQLVQSEKLASIGQLTAGIAHEINNPVNYINAGIDSLTTNVREIDQIMDLYQRLTKDNFDRQSELIRAEEEKIDVEETRKEIRNLLQSVRNGAERTTEIVKGLRTFSRLDENEIKPADIHEGIDLTLVMLHNKYKHHVKIIKQYGELPMVDCYPGKLNQVFMNILSNGIEAITEKGTITIKTWEDKPEKNVFISIKDDGEGMSESTLKNIFNPFFTTKEVGKGTGMGLSISHGIIEQHKGKIEVKSKPGEGAEFIIFLPVKQP
jgi:signal transduction histidine kinase